jgi:hypothetical protein
MADSQNITLTYSDAVALAERLIRRNGGHSLTGAVAVLETDATTASRLIRAMLRQVHSSDIFHLPGGVTPHGAGSPRRQFFRPMEIVNDRNEYHGAPPGRDHAEKTQRPNCRRPQTS